MDLQDNQPELTTSDQDLDTQRGQEGYSRNKYSINFTHIKKNKSINKTINEDQSMVRLPTLKPYQSKHSTIQNSPKNRTSKHARSHSQHGIEVYNVLNQKKVADQQVQLMENRLNKLELEEQRNIKKIQQTIERTKEYERIKEMKDKKKQDWSSYMQNQNQRIDQLRKQLQDQREDRYRRMKEYVESDMLNKRNQNQELNKSLKQLNQSLRKSLDQKLMQRQLASQTLKSEIIGGIYQRRSQKSSFEMQLSQQYKAKKDEAEEKIGMNKSKIQEMEQKERELLQKLQTTLKTKQDLMNNLQNMQWKRRSNNDVVSLRKSDNYLPTATLLAPE